MTFIKKIWDKIKEPHGLWLVLFYLFFIAVVSGTLVLVILIPKQGIFHYLLYPVAAISLTYFIYTIVYFAPKMKANVIKTLKQFKLTSEMLENYGFRTMMFSLFTFSLNILYVLFLAVMSIITNSYWYISMTAYYLILCFMKGNVLLSNKRKKNCEIKRARSYRFSGIMFILLTIAFSGVIVLVYMTDMTFEYAGLMIYVIATYTFYNLTLSIYNIIKARKQDDLYVQNIRNINLATSLISIIVLQVALFQAFSPESNKGFANGLTGGVVSLIILILGILMIIQANKHLKNLETKDESEQK